MTSTHALTFGSPQQQVEINALTQALSASRLHKATILVTISGSGFLSARTALLLSDLIQAAQTAGARVIGNATCPLYGGAALVWLNAAHRTLYPSGYLHIYSKDVYVHHILHPIALDGQDTPTPSALHEIADYNEVLNRLDEYLPVWDLTDQRLSTGQLQELLLLGPLPISAATYLPAQA